MKEPIFGADDPKKDQKIIKTCENCGIKYHPRKNGYEATSRFCTQTCTKQARKTKRFRPFIG